MFLFLYIKLFLWKEIPKKRCISLQKSKWTSRHLLASEKRNRNYIKLVIIFTLHTN